MSKLYKELKYDTDRIMQPGDPLTSFDGNTAIKAGNATGKGFIETYGEPVAYSYEVTVDVPQVPGASCRVRIDDTCNTTMEITILDISGWPGATASGSDISVNDSSWGYFYADYDSSGVADPSSVIPTKEDSDTYDTVIHCHHANDTQLCTSWSNLTKTRQTTSKEISTTDQIPSLPLSVANGGTGVDGSSQSANKVLASPSSGSGAISFRSLTVADLPTGTTSSTVALGDHTHSDYVSKSATSNQTVSSEITMPALTVGSRNSTGTVGAKSVSEGHTNTASGECSHAEGHNSVASEYCAHAEGQTSTASGYVSHAEGQSCTASGYTSHAEGYCNTASGSCSHAEGAGTYAVGENSHAEGCGSTATWLGARGNSSHVEGYNTVAQNNYEHAQGWYNASHKASDTFGDSGNTLSSIGFKVGDGSVPSNAVEVMQDGKVFIYGMGGYNGTNPTGTGVKDLATVASGDHTHNSLRSSASTTDFSTVEVTDSGNVYLNVTSVGTGGALQTPAPRATTTYTLLSIFGQDAGVSKQQPNKVLAGPSSGSNSGSISFRSLVAADIPTLSTSKISGLGDAATKNVGTASGTVAAGDHTHSDYVSKTTTTGQIISSSIAIAQGHALEVGNQQGGYIILRANEQPGDDYTYIQIGQPMVETVWIGKDVIGHNVNGTNETRLSFPVPAKSGVIATSVDIAGCAASDHTHSSLKNGSYTASLPTLTANKTLAITDDLNILPITTSTALTITMTADKYMYKVTDSGATGTFPTLTAPTGLPADCYYKFEMEWVTASPTATYSQTASTTPAMKWISSPVMQTDGLSHTYHISGRYDTTTSTFWMSCWKIDEAQGTITPNAHTLKYLLTTPAQVVSTTTDTDDTITVQLSDHAINTVQVPTTATSVVMKFPGQAVGKARDFMVRLIVTGETVPSVTLTEPDGSAIDFDVDDDSWTEIDQGVNLLMFTETAQ